MIEDQNKQIASISINEVILAQLRDLKESQRDLRAEVKDIRQELKATRDELNRRMDKQETKLEELNKKVDAKFDRLTNKIDSISSHGQIATISSVGVGVSAVSITLGVLYALIFK